MKIKIKKKIYWILGGVLSLVILLAVINPEAVFLMLFGNKYSSCGITTISDRKNFSGNATKQEVHIYKADNKPFLLVGPYTFSPDCRDFFFVNKKQLIRTATDKGGEAFFQFASWLFVIDDMSGTYQNRIRAPWWDELKNKNASAVQKNDQYIYTLFLEDEKKYVTFSIPANMLNCLVEGAVL